MNLRAFPGVVHPPTPPTNVQVELITGETIPVDCVYAGVDDGVHMWVAIYPMPTLVRQLSVEVLPARTGIRISMYDPRVT